MPAGDDIWRIRCELRRRAAVRVRVVDGQILVGAGPVVRVRSIERLHERDLQPRRGGGGGGRAHQQQSRCRHEALRF